MEFEDILKLMKSENHVLKDSGFNEVFKKLEQPLIGFYMHRKLNKSEAEEVVISSLVKNLITILTVLILTSCTEQDQINTKLLDHFKKYKKYKNDVLNLRIREDS